MNDSAALEVTTGTARLLRAARTSPLLRQVGQMIATRGVGLVVAAAGSIWMQRCLGPEKLGISGMILALLAPMGLLVDLNQDVSLVRRYKACETDDARAQLIRETFIFRGLLCLAYMAVIAAVVTLAGLPGADWRLGVVAAFPLLLVTANQGSWVLQAQENMPARYRALMLQSLISAGCYFAFFRPGRMPAGSDIIVMAAAVAAEYTLGWWYARRPVQSALSSRRGSDLLRGLRLAGEACWAGRWLAITGLLSYLYIFLQNPLIGILLGNEALGLYRSAGTLLNAFQAFAAMVPALLYPRMIEWHRIGPAHLWAKQMKFARVAFCFFVPGAIAAFLLAPYLYRLLYGPVFLPAAYPCALLLVARMMTVLNGIFGWGLWAQHRDGLMLRLTVGTAVISLGLNLWLIPRMGLIGAAGVCVLCETLMLFATALASRMLLRQSTKHPTDKDQTLPTSPAFPADNPPPAPAMSTPNVSSSSKKSLLSSVRKSLGALATKLGLRKTWDEKFYAEVSAFGKDSPNVWIRRSSEIGGWLFEGEHEALWELATRDVAGNVLEIGSWMGKSACILAGACVDHHPETVVLCVDTFTMSGTEQQTKHHAKLVGRAQGTFYDFISSAKRLGFYDHVIPLGQYSQRALKVVKGPLRLAFIDGAHDYANVESEVALVLPLIAPGGSLALHDVYSGSYPELLAFVDEKMLTNPALEFIGPAGSIAIFRKR